MTSPNQYLRRADVEALLDDQIATLHKESHRLHDQLAENGLSEGERRSALTAGLKVQTAMNALATAKEQLGLCQRFTYRTFTSYDGRGTKTHALVSNHADRVPLDPETD